MPNAANLNLGGLIMKAREFIGKSFSSKLFLTMTIGLALYCGGSILSAIISLLGGVSGVLDLVIEAALLIAPVISLLAAYKLYRGEVNSYNIRKLKSFCTFIKVLCIVLAVLLAVIGFILIIGVSMISSMLTSNSDYLDIFTEALNEVDPAVADAALQFLSAGAAIIIAITVVVVGFGISFSILLASTFSDLGKRNEELAAAYDADGYLFENKTPKIRLWITGVICAVMVLLTLTASFADAIGMGGLALYLISAAIWFDENTKEQIKLREEEWNRESNTTDPYGEPAYAPVSEPAYVPAPEQYESPEPAGRPTVDLGKKPSGADETPDSPSNEKNVANKLDKGSR